MESQKERFRREWMEIRDDRKIRGFDQQSIERRQRIMPQGQKDLGIYPGENYGEELPEFGYRMPVRSFESQELEVDEATGTPFIRATTSLEGRDASNYGIVVSEPNLIFTNMKIFSVTSAPLGSLYPAKFINCTFLELPEEISSYFSECVFEKCDFDFYVQGIIDILVWRML